LKGTDFDRYRRLYVLVQKRGGGMRGPPGMGGPMTRVPDGATVVKDGEWFTLYEVPASARAQIEAEANQTQQATSPRGRNGRRPQR
jgi:hypothetical protein